MVLAAHVVVWVLLAAYLAYLHRMVLGARRG